MRRETLKLERRPSVVRFLIGRLDVERHPIVIILRDGSCDVMIVQIWRH